MFVKICGTTSLADAELAIELGADALGFIFAPSKRRVNVEQVAAITNKVTGNVLLVGVFTEPNVDEIVRTARKARLSAVQMHWPYNSQVVDELVDEADAFELWQVVGFPIDPVDQKDAEQQFGNELRAALLDGRLDCILLDAVKGGASGGMGQAFSWSRATEVVNRVTAEIRQREPERVLPHIVLAGGLRPENVAEAVRTLQPWGVDVVSGVEASPGKKSPDRLKAFMKAVRQGG
jgi:phosphoribosylanthranilate isomerase